MKQSPLRDVHSPQMEFAAFMGMELPRVFTNVEDEVLATIGSVAMMDRSFYGRIRVTGADSIDLLHRISTNDLTKLAPGKAVPTIFTNEKGRLIDYVWIVALEKELIIVCSPGREQTLISWMDKYTISEDVYLEDMRSSTGMLSLLGPGARLTAAQNDILRPENVFEPINSGVAYVTADFHTPSVTIIASVDELTSVWNRLRVVTRPMGFEAFDTYRISRGIPLPDHEISERFNPYDVGLTHAISYTKGCYIGQEVIARLDTYQKAKKTLAGIIFPEYPEGIGNYAEILYGSEEGGVLTSVSRTPVKGSYVGAAVIRRDILNPGAEVSLKGAEFPGRVQEFPLSFDHSGKIQ
jgi:tRNA-modifying protein YgfZ